MILSTLYKFKVGKYLVSIEGLVINQVQHRLRHLFPFFHLEMLNQVQHRFRHVIKTSTVILENFVLKIYSESVSE